MFVPCFAKEQNREEVREALNDMHRPRTKTVTFSQGVRPYGRTASAPSTKSTTTLIAPMSGPGPLASMGSYYYHERPHVVSCSTNTAGNCVAVPGSEMIPAQALFRGAGCEQWQHAQSGGSASAIPSRRLKEGGLDVRELCC